MIRVLAAAAAALAIAVSLSSQSQRVGLPVPGSEGESISATVRVVSTSARPGGHGFVRVDLANPTEDAHAVEVEVSETWSQTFSALSRIELEPAARTRLFLPIRHVGYQARLRCRVDGGRWAMVGTTIESPDGVGLSVGIVTAPGFDAPGFRAVLERLIKTAPTTGAAFGDPKVISIFEELRPDELPPTWDGISGFDLVVVDARRGAIDRSTQGVLRDYLRTGGQLLVLGVEALDGGPLAAALAASPLALGFGRGLGLTNAEANGLPGDRAAIARISPWLLDPDGPLVRGARPVSGPLPPELYQPVVIPGVGDVPYRAYLAVLLLFGVLVGPVNYLVLRRRRQLGYMLLTVPALGLLTTAILLSYGLFRDGLGLRSAARSLTLLDQEAHEAVSWEGRTVFAGLSPSDLRPRATTAFDVTAILQSRGSDEGFLLGFADGVVGGAAVPARTLVTFGVASVGTERARLRFARRAEGGFDVLVSDGLQPAAGAGNVVLRAVDGTYWLQAADGGMVNVTAEEAIGTVDRLLRGFDGIRVPLDPTFGGGSFPLGVTFGEGVTTARLKAAAGSLGLPAGCYLAVVARPALLDDLGLAGEDLGHHLVLGRLGPEDIVD